MTALPKPGKSDLYFAMTPLSLASWKISAFSDDAVCLPFVLSTCSLCVMMVSAQAKKKRKEKRKEKKKIVQGKLFQKKFLSLSLACARDFTFTTVSSGWKP
jgi:hypothetical protein